MQAPVVPLLVPHQGRQGSFFCKIWFKVYCLGTRVVSLAPGGV